MQGYEVVCVQGYEVLCACRDMRCCVHAGIRGVVCVQGYEVLCACRDTRSTLVIALED